MDARPQHELKELTEIYCARGLSEDTARRVAEELTAHDVLGAHARDELGLSDTLAADPLQAAFVSGATFTVAGSLPLLAAALAPGGMIVQCVLAATLLALVVLGTAGARAGGAPPGPAMLRVVMWGVFAMAVTAGVGRLFGVAV